MPPIETFDFIIVGAGSAGCLLADVVFDQRPCFRRAEGQAERGNLSRRIAPSSETDQR